MTVLTKKSRLRAKLFNMKPVVGIFCAGLISSIVAVQAAEMTTREVISAIFKSNATAPVDFSDLDLSFLDLSNVDFKKAQFTGADLYGSDLSEADLSGTDLTETRLDRTTIVRSNFSGADLSGATMRRPSGFTSLAYDRRDAPNFEGAKLVGTRVHGRLDGANFRNADLSKSMFAPEQVRGETLSTLLMSHLTGADFRGAKLHDADFSRTVLKFANFTGADLKGANFSKSNLARADFTNANIAGVDFTDADLEGVIFEGVKGLSHARGIKSAAANAP
ncbi:MAG: pentapeptide repeat-containing protein [Hyphomicrobiaceae bacterium]